jgi:hypothetical protein
MIQMKLRSVASLIVAYPLAIAMNMGRLGMTFLIAEVLGRRGGMFFRPRGRGGMLLLARRGSFDGGWSFRRDISSANVRLSAARSALFLMLGKSPYRANQQYSQTASNYLFHCSLRNLNSLPLTKTLYFVRMAHMRAPGTR